MVVSSIIPDSRDDYEAILIMFLSATLTNTVSKIRSHGHMEHGIAQANLGRMTKRFRYSSDVDAEGTDHNPHAVDIDDSD